MLIPTVKPTDPTPPHALPWIVDVTGAIPATTYWQLARTVGACPARMPLIVNTAAAQPR